MASWTPEIWNHIWNQRTCKKTYPLIPDFPLWSVMWWMWHLRHDGDLCWLANSVGWFTVHRNLLRFNDDDFQAQIVPVFNCTLFEYYYPYFQSDCYSVMIVIVTASRDTPRGVSVYLKQMLKTPRHLCPLIIIRIKRLSLSSQTSWRLRHSHMHDMATSLVTCIM